MSERLTLSEVAELRSVADDMCDWWSDRSKHIINEVNNSISSRMVDRQYSSTVRRHDLHASFVRVIRLIKCFNPSVIQRSASVSNTLQPLACIRHKSQSTRRIIDTIFLLLLYDVC